MRSLVVGDNAGSFVMGATMAPFAGIPTDLVDSLGCKSPHDALLALANESEQMAAKLAEELALSLSGRGGRGTSDATGKSSSSSKYHHGPSPSKQKMSKLIMEGSDNSSSNNKDDASRRGGFPIPLPRSLRASRHAGIIIIRQWRQRFYSRKQQQSNKPPPPPAPSTNPTPPTP